MDTTINGKHNCTINVFDENCTGVVEVVVTSPEGKATIQLSNGDVFSLALLLLNCVEHTR